MSNVSLAARVEWTVCENGFSKWFDTYSYHATLMDAQNYVNEYYADFPADPPPRYYTPGQAEMIAVDPLFALLVQSDGILWDEADHTIVNDNF